MTRDPTLKVLEGKRERKKEIGGGGGSGGGV